MKLLDQTEFKIHQRSFSLSKSSESYNFYQRPRFILFLSNLCEKQFIRATKYWFLFDKASIQGF